MVLFNICGGGLDWYRGCCCFNDGYERSRGDGVELGLSTHSNLNIRVMSINHSKNRNQNLSMKKGKEKPPKSVEVISNSEIIRHNFFFKFTCNLNAIKVFRVLCFAVKKYKPTVLNTTLQNILISPIVKQLFPPKILESIVMGSDQQ